VLIERFQRWFEYEIDAHAKTIASLESVPLEKRGGSEFKKAAAVFGHLVAARRVWLFRLGIASAPVGSLFPEDPDLAEVISGWREAEGLWKNYLSTLSDADIEKVFEYKAFDGGRFRNTIEEILTQLFGHSSYHRGQIAMLVKTAGGTPAVTDYVYWCREGVS
jgi:uncharacterized damage-inducible protein DinB